MKNSITARLSVRKRNPLDKNKLKNEEKKKKLENKNSNSLMVIINLNQETISRNSSLRTPTVHIFGFNSSLTLSKKKASLQLEKSLNVHSESLTSQTSKRNSIYTLHT
jgi:hypothetical protein